MSPAKFPVLGVQVDRLKGQSSPFVLLCRTDDEPLYCPLWVTSGRSQDLAEPQVSRAHSARPSGVWRRVETECNA